MRDRIGMGLNGKSTKELQWTQNRSRARVHRQWCSQLACAHTIPFHFIWSFYQWIVRREETKRKKRRLTRNFLIKIGRKMQLTAYFDSFLRFFFFCSKNIIFYWMCIDSREERGHFVNAHKLEQTCGVEFSRPMKRKFRFQSTRIVSFWCFSLTTKSPFDTNSTVSDGQTTMNTDSGGDGSAEWISFGLDVFFSGGGRQRTKRKSTKVKIDCQFKETSA